MYLAHSGVALASKRVDERLPLSWCLTAAWVFDLTGIGHWIPFALAFAAVAYWTANRRWDGRAGVILASTVLLHDVLDLVVGVQLLPGGQYLGPSLAGGSLVELALEVMAICAGWTLYRATQPTDQRHRPLLYVPLVVMLVFAGAHAATSSSTDSSSTSAQLLILVPGLVLSWYALIAIDRRLRMESTSGRTPDDGN